MLETLLKEHGGELIASMTQGGGLEPAQAESLLPPALGQIGEVLQGGGGGLDLGDLLGGGEGAIGALLGKLDVGQIAGMAGLDEAQTQSGLASLIPVVVSLLGEKGGGVEGLLSMLGGGSGSKKDLAGALGGIAGKLFGK